MPLAPARNKQTPKSDHMISARSSYSIKSRLTKTVSVFSIVGGTGELDPVSPDDKKVRGIFGSCEKVSFVKRKEVRK